MDLEWDERKRALNRAKHGVDFALAEAFEWETARLVPDLRAAYGEARFLAYGVIAARLYALVFTPRGARCSIISLRKANGKEISAYETAVGT